MTNLITNGRPYMVSFMKDGLRVKYTVNSSDKRTAIKLIESQTLIKPDGRISAQALKK